MDLDEFLDRMRSYTSGLASEKAGQAWLDGLRKVGIREGPKLDDTWSRFVTTWKRERAPKAAEVKVLYDGGMTRDVPNRAPESEIRKRLDALGYDEQAFRDWWNHKISYDIEDSSDTLGLEAIDNQIRLFRHWQRMPERMQRAYMDTAARRRPQSGRRPEWGAWQGAEHHEPGADG